MIKTTYATKDATLYEATASMNTGNDEILELSKDVSGSYGALARSRVIVQFDTETLSASMADQGFTAEENNIKYFVKLFISEEQDAAAEYDIALRAVRTSFTRGTGRKTNLPITTNGVSWTYRNGESDLATAWSTPGGDFYDTAGAASASFKYVQGDIEVDVTDIVEFWNTTAITTLPKGALWVMRSGSQETDITDYGTQFYYSSNTNTIYPPRLEVRYDNASHAFQATSGSVVSVGDEIEVQPRLRPEYRQNSVERIFVDTSIKGGARSQVGGVGDAYNRFLPQSSSYAIIDNATGEYVHNHDPIYTYIGRTGNAQNYFDIDMNGLFPERYYTVELKVNHYTGTAVVATRYYKSKTIFKVVK